MIPAKTRVEAEAQTLDLPPQFPANWRGVARLLDGYAVAGDMGLDFGTWTTAQVEAYYQSGVWNLTTIELRVMLFWAYRSDYFTGYTYNEHDRAVLADLDALGVQRRTQAVTRWIGRGCPRPVDYLSCSAACPASVRSSGRCWW